METYSPNYLARAFDIDRATAVRVVKDIEPDQQKTNGRPTFTIATFARALELHRLANASNNDGGTESASASASLTAARTRIAVASAEAKELANHITRGNFISRDVMLDLLTPTFLTMREIMLSLPGKISDALTPHCSEDRGAIFEIVNREVRENLENLASADSFADAAIPATAKGDSS